MGELFTKNRRLFWTYMSTFNFPLGWWQIYLGRLSTEDVRLIRGRGSIKTQKFRYLFLFLMKFYCFYCFRCWYCYLKEVARYSNLDSFCWKTLNLTSLPTSYFNNKIYLEEYFGNYLKIKCLKSKYFRDIYFD